MKKLGLVLGVLLAFLMIKFLFMPSFFVKVGCKSKTEEYALFLEAGRLKEAPPTAGIYESATSHKDIDVKDFFSKSRGKSIQESKTKEKETIVPVKMESVKSADTLDRDNIDSCEDNIIIESGVASTDQSSIEDLILERDFIVAEPVPIETFSLIDIEPKKQDSVVDPPSLTAWKSTSTKEEDHSDGIPFDPYPWPKRITIRHVLGDQENCSLPFASNFTTYELLFAPDYRAGHVLPLLDFRLHRFDNNTYATNLGVGGRTIPKNGSRFCELLGFNAYYDYRQGCIGYYNQFGLGVEVLGKRWDFRANAYFPFGAKRAIHTCLFDDYEGEDYYYAKRCDIESVSYSFNAELGYMAVKSKYFLLYTAAGPYFLARNCSNGTAGGEIRVRPQYKDYVALDLSWRHDGLFETIWQMEIIVNLPLYQFKDRNQRPCGFSDREIYQPIERFEVMPLNKRSCWESNF